MLQVLKKFFDKQEPVNCEWLAKLDHNTPDIWQLQQYTRQLVFVCDDLMTGGINNELVSAGSFIPRAFHPSCYTTHNYTLWRKDLGEYSFPVALPASYKPSGFVRWPVEPAPIRGELWSIRPSQFILLDKHRQNGVQCVRKRVEIRYPYRTVAYDKERPLPHISDQTYFTTVEAWMYIGDPNYWDPLIGGVFANSQMELYERDIPVPWMKKYYKFVPPTKNI